MLFPAVVRLCHRPVSLSRFIHTIAKRHLNPLFGGGLWGSEGIRSVGRMVDFDVGKEFLRDTVLYKSDNLRNLRLLQLFAGLNFVVWVYSASFLLNYVGSISAKEEEKDNLDPTQKNSPGFWKAVSRAERKYHTYLAFGCCLIGYGGLLVIGLYSTRCVNTLIVKRGGEEVIILTSRMVAISKLRQLTVPLRHISCKTTREQARPYMTIKIKGQWLYFLIDKNATFYNTYLFDRTISLHRNLNKV